MTSYVPPWSPWYGPRSRGEVHNAEMRVSDADRSEVADALSKNYSEGRLDEAEFNDRLQRAMSAKTRGDLAGLLVDLPPTSAAPLPAAVVRHRRGRVWLLVLFVFLFAMVVSSPFAWALNWHFPWLLFFVLLFVLWRVSHRGWHRHRSRYPDRFQGPGRGTWM